MAFTYNSISTSKARQLRQQQTNTERLLWSKLRAKQISNQKFYRQYPIGIYIVDFYCPAKKLVIELDGSQHIGQVNYDNKRSDYLNQLGIKVLRFWDNEVLQKTSAVLEIIHQMIAI